MSSRSRTAIPPTLVLEGTPAMSIYVCHHCGLKTDKIRSFIRHIANHGHTSKSYYDAHIKKKNEGLCPCGNRTRYLNFTKGYQRNCSKKCGSKEALLNQWSGEKDKLRKELLSKSMIGNKYSQGRPLFSKNKNPYPIESVYKRLKNTPMPSWSGKTHSTATKVKMSKSAYIRMEKYGLPKVSYKGRFIPSNPKKYEGDCTNIIYRSLWEKTVFKFLDENPNVVAWSSEELVVPYISPIDGRPHRYYPDVIVKIRINTGHIKTRMIEIKPKAQTVEPKSQKRKTRRYITEVMTWGVNSAKWSAAREYCKNRGWEFQIMTEDQIFGKK